MKSKKIKIKAYAKVNLFLKITGIREDGYHILSSTMQTISLYDRVSVKKSDKLLCVCGDIPSEKNIAYKAVRALEEISGKELPVFIKIKKRIPDKAGLGGGSADAAAVMKAVISLYDLSLSEKEIRKKILYLTAYFIGGLKALPVYSIYSTPNACGIIALKHKRIDSEYLADILSEKYDIAVRGGLHCAPLMHQALRTEDSGLVRVSFSHFNSEKEVDALLFALEELAHL